MAIQQNTATSNSKPATSAAPVLFRLPNLRADARHSATPTHDPSDDSGTVANASRSKGASPSLTKTNTAAHSATSSSDTTTSSDTSSADSPTRVSPSDKPTLLTKRWSSGVVLFSVALLVLLICYLGLPTGVDPVETAMVEAGVSIDELEPPTFSNGMFVAAPANPTAKDDTKTATATAPVQSASPSKPAPFQLGQPSEPATDPIIDTDDVSSLLLSSSNSESTTKLDAEQDTSAEINNSPSSLLIGSTSAPSNTNVTASTPSVPPTGSSQRVVQPDSNLARSNSFDPRGVSPGFQPPENAIDPPSLGNDQASMDGQFSRVGWAGSQPAGSTNRLVNTNESDTTGFQSSTSTATGSPQSQRRITETQAAELNVMELFAARQRLMGGSMNTAIQGTPAQQISSGTANVLFTGTPNFGPQTVPPAAPGYSTNLQRPIPASGAEYQPLADNPAALLNSLNNTPKPASTSQPYVPLQGTNPPSETAKPYTPLGPLSMPGN